MPKRLNDIQKKEIIKRFLNGETPDILSEEFGYTKLTILSILRKVLEKNFLIIEIKVISPLITIS